MQANPFNESSASTRYSWACSKQSSSTWTAQIRRRAHAAATVLNNTDLRRRKQQQMALAQAVT